MLTEPTSILNRMRKHPIILSIWMRTLATFLECSVYLYVNCAFFITKAGVVNFAPHNPTSSVFSCRFISHARAVARVKKNRAMVRVTKKMTRKTMTPQQVAPFIISKKVRWIWQIYSAFNTTLLPRSLY